MTAQPPPNCAPSNCAQMNMVAIMICKKNCPPTKVIPPTLTWGEKEISHFLFSPCLQYTVEEDAGRCRMVL